MLLSLRPDRFLAYAAAERLDRELTDGMLNPFTGRDLASAEITTVTHRPRPPELMIRKRLPQQRQRLSHLRIYGNVPTRPESLFFSYREPCDGPSSADVLSIRYGLMTWPFSEHCNYTTKNGNRSKDPFSGGICAWQLSELSISFHVYMSLNLLHPCGLDHGDFRDVQAVEF